MGQQNRILQMRAVSSSKNHNLIGSLKNLENTENISEEELSDLFYTLELSKNNIKNLKNQIKSKNELEEIFQAPELKKKNNQIKKKIEKEKKKFEELKTEIIRHKQNKINQKKELNNVNMNMFETKMETLSERKKRLENLRNKNFGNDPKSKINNMNDKAPNQIDKENNFENIFKHKF